MYSYRLKLDEVLENTCGEIDIYRAVLGEYCNTKGLKAKLTLAWESKKCKLTIYEGPNVILSTNHIGM
jgi:hypothetical protein